MRLTIGLLVGLVLGITISAAFSRDLTTTDFNHGRKVGYSECQSQF